MLYASPGCPCSAIARYAATTSSTGRKSRQDSRLPIENTGSHRSLESLLRLHRGLQVEMGTLHVWGCLRDVPCRIVRRNLQALCEELIALIAKLRVGVLHPRH